MNQNDMTIPSMPTEGDYLNMIVDGIKVKLNFVSSADERIINDLKTFILRSVSNYEIV